MIEGRGRCIVVANGSYLELQNLDQAVADALDLKTVLEGKQTYDTVVLQNLERGDLLDRIDQDLGQNTATDGSLILVWVGHGQVGADNALRLMVRSKARDVQAADAGDLGEWTARTGARQALVLIDTCHSGAGMVNAADLANAVIGGREAPGKAWFGVIAASLADEPARSGALIRNLTELLGNGPQKPDFRWHATRPYIRADDVLSALVENWNEPRQTPFKLTLGLATDFIRNPNFVAGIPEQTIDHLLQAARGGAGGESYFTGRKPEIVKIVDWLDLETPGLLVLTGPPGSGKSAIAGRIASLSSPSERENLFQTLEVPSEMDPGVESVDGQLHARGMTVELASELLARQLGLSASTAPYAILAEARRRREASDPLVIFVDGLDEAGTYAERLAHELITPLIREALVLVATRDMPVGDKTLISLIGPTAALIDLGQDPESTRQDIAKYVQQRLTGVAQTMDPVLVAEQLTSDGPPQFLLARLVTSQLRETPVDTSDEMWRMSLATTVESALERDLQNIVMTIEGKPHPTAARELICALSLSYGSGFPADELWSAVATAISPTLTTYSRDDVIQLLSNFGRHLIAGTEGGEPVYRIAHQSLANYVREDVTLTSEEPAMLEKVADVVFAQYDAWLDQEHAPQEHRYLWSYAWRHLADAGTNGLAHMRRLLVHDRKAFLPDLAQALELASRKSFANGDITLAVKFSEESIDLRRQIGDDLALSMALFSMTFIQSSAGEQAAADETAREAAEIARSAGDTPEAREVLWATLLARSSSLLWNGHLQSASVLAQEALELVKDGGVNDQSALSTAYALKGRIAFLLGEYETALEMCRQAVELIDAQPDDGKSIDVLNETLGVIAAIEVMNSTKALPDSSGKFAPVVMPAAERMLKDFQVKGRYGTISDIAVAGGIFMYARGKILDILNGCETMDPSEVSALFQDAFGLLRPLTDNVFSAAIVMAEGLISFMQINPADAATEADYVEQRLRPLAESNILAAGVLGQLLDMRNAQLIGSLLRQGVEDGSALVDRQREAVTWLGKSNIFQSRVAYAFALSRLSSLSDLGLLEPNQAMAVRSDAIEAWSQLIDAVPNARLQLVALQSDQVAQLAVTNPTVAIELGREVLLNAKELSSQQFAVVIGAIEANLAGALLSVHLIGKDNREEASRLVKSAVARLEPLAPNPLAPNPLAPGALAAAYLNAGLLELLDDNYERALELAEQALACLNTAQLLPAHGALRPMARILLGRAQRDSGQVEIGEQTLKTEIEQLLASVKEGSSRGAQLAGILNSVVPFLWDEVLESLGDKPDLQRVLSTVRHRPAGEMSVTVDTLIKALAESKDTENSELRSIARMQRSLASDEFDAAWFERTGSIAQWLKLDLKHIGHVVEWLNTPTWKLSRDYLAKHPSLLHDPTDAVLDELALDGASDALVKLHRELLHDSRQVGIKAAYGSLLAEAEIEQWMQSGDQPRYLIEHSELMRPEIKAMLHANAANDANSAFLLAVLDLTSRGEGELASEAIRNPDSVLDQLKASWRCGDIDRLESLATVIWISANDEQMRRKSRLSMAIAGTLGRKEGNAEPSIEVLEGGSQSERTELIGMVADAIQYHPAFGPQLSYLINLLGE